jgi:hypothetical protein
MNIKNMRVKWKTYKEEEFEGIIIDTLCNLLYVKLDDGSIKMIDVNCVTIVGKYA